MPKKKAPMFLRLIVYLVFLLALLAIGGFWYIDNLKSPVNSDTSAKAFVIQKGESMDSVANRLQDEGLIRSSFIFKYLLKQTGVETKIAAGDYKLSPSMSVEEIITSMNKGVIDKWVTFLEGWRVEEMALKLEKELGVKSSEFLKYSKEGYMFPDTYLVNKDMTAADITSLLKNTFNQKYSQDLRLKIKDFGLTEEQGVIMASLVEREARSDEVRTQVAGIILKRLKIGMKLDIDATVRYAKDSQIIKSGKLPDQFWGAISASDYTDVKSSYNTYLNNGLPPAPICNPSLSSLKAVANASSNTPYLYYYHDSQGNTYYASTLEGHNQNVANHR